MDKGIFYLVISFLLGVLIVGSATAVGKKIDNQCAPKTVVSVTPSPAVSASPSVSETPVVSASPAALFKRSSTVVPVTKAVK